MAILVVLFWVLLGVGVFALAMRGGPRGRTPAHLQDRTSGRIVAVVVTIAVAFGIAVPTLVLAFNGSNRAAVGPGGTTLNAVEQHGRFLFSQVCDSCHTLAAAAAVGKIGPNLDILQPPYALVLNAILQGRARGQGNMPAMLYQGRDAQSVAAFVAATAGR